MRFFALRRRTTRVQRPIRKVQDAKPLRLAVHALEQRMLLDGSGNLALIDPGAGPTAEVGPSHAGVTQVTRLAAATAGATLLTSGTLFTFTPAPLVGLPCVGDASISFDDTTGTIEVSGTDCDDTVSVERRGANIRVTINGQSFRTAAADVDQVWIYAQAGDDTVTNSTTKASYVYADEGNDTITGGNSFDYVDGSDGNDVIYGQGGGDILYGGAGDDIIYGGAGDDAILSDEDYIVGDEDPGGNDTIYGQGGADSLRAGDGDDLVSGQAGSDTLDGEEGGDTLRGGDQGDTIYGGDDGDQLYGDNGTDLLYGESGSDTIRGGAHNDTADGGSASDSIHGGDGADSLTGDTGDDTIRGEAGDDSIAGDDGADMVYGGTGGDTISGGDDADELRGENGADSVQGDAGNDTLYGGDGEDNISGSSGDDEIHAGSGGDAIDGGDDDDLVYSEDGSDTAHGGSGNDTLYGGSGRDNLYGDGDEDALHGGDDDDGLYGGGDSDDLSGGDGHDRFLTGTSSDTIHDRSSADALIEFNTGTQAWDEDEIERVDGEVLSVLHAFTGNSRLLKQEDYSNLVFVRDTLCDLDDDGTTDCLAYNNGEEIHVADVTMTGSKPMKQILFHEVGHHWDGESSIWEDFKDLSGWEETSDGDCEAGQTASDNGNWCYDSTAPFIREHSTDSPPEDFATVFELFFMDYIGEDYYTDGAVYADTATLIASVQDKYDMVEDYLNSL